MLNKVKLRTYLCLWFPTKIYLVTTVYDFTEQIKSVNKVLHKEHSHSN